MRAQDYVLEEEQINVEDLKCQTVPAGSLVINPTEMQESAGGSSRPRLRCYLVLHQIAFGDVIGAAFGVEDQEAVEARPVIDLPRISAA